MHSTLGLILASTVVLLLPARAQEHFESGVLPAPQQEAGARFGATVAALDDLLFVAAPEEDRGGVDAGVVYVFERTNGLWFLRQTLQAQLPTAGARFGAALAVEAETLAVGAPNENARGAVYVFRRAADLWAEVARLQPATAGNGDEFGAALALEGPVLAVGAPADEVSGSAADCGAVHPYRFNGTNWVAEGAFTRFGALSGDRFGASLAIDAEQIVSGAPGENASTTDDGAVYIYGHPAGNWIQGARLVSPTPNEGLSFGHVVSADGGRIAVGVPEEDSAALNGGAVFTYVLTAGMWNPLPKLTAPGTLTGSRFGSSLALNGDDLFVGVPGGLLGGPAAGEIMTYEAVSGGWTSGPRLGASAPTVTDSVGAVVAGAGTWVVSGSPTDDIAGTDSGRVVLFDLTCSGSIRTGMFTATRCLPLTALDWSRPLEIPRFDPIFGALTAVRFTLNGHLEGGLRFENLSLQAGAYSYQADATLRILRPNGSTLASLLLPLSGSGALAPFDGLADFAGASGVTFDDLQLDDILVADAPDAANDRLLFTGPLANPGTIRLALEGTLNFQRSTSANVLREFDPFAASAFLEIEYLFEPSGTPYCFGDGGVSMGCTPCLCSNDAPPGTQGGCLNLNGTSGRLVAAGAPRIIADTLQFFAEGATPSTFGVLISGVLQLPAFGACPVGSGIADVPLKGLRCAGGMLVRHGSRATNAAGTTPVPWGYPANSLLAQAGVVAGQTRNFQVFYRELPTIDCPYEQNTTNGVRVIVAP